MAINLKFNIQITNRAVYTFLAIFVIIALAVGVYAYTSSIPNPGHGADRIWVSVGDEEMTLQEAIDQGFL